MMSGKKGAALFLQQSCRLLFLFLLNDALCFFCGASRVTQIHSQGSRHRCLTVAVSVFNMTHPSPDGQRAKLKEYVQHTALQRKHSCRYDITNLYIVSGI